MSKLVTIYSLSDPTTNQVRYVGQTYRGIGRRLTEHLRAAKKGRNWPVSRWIRKLLRESKCPSISVLQIVLPSEDWRIAEAKWILKFKSEEGSAILNATKGGDGTVGHHHSEETRSKMRQIAKEQGRKPPGNLGRIFDEKARSNMSVAHKGKSTHKWSEEQRKKFLAKRKYQPWSPELRCKIMAARKRYKITDAHRKSLSEAGKIAWLKRKLETKIST